ncbi:uncharacterized protein LOC114526786 [Dendronephthya gigantea]|uniref:uncharacterized protein LOC114526786 n=1 Tax=Dendronephthya gigantea TaxID=151771 RepID=UPI00106C29C5|nr:uncharacterized protein LOC114526786 [Dendronephthya gigantea]
MKLAMPGVFCYRADNIETIKKHLDNYLKTGDTKTPDRGRGHSVSKRNGRYVSASDEEDPSDKVPPKKPKCSRTMCTNNTDNMVAMVKAKYSLNDRTNRRCSSNDDDTDDYSDDQSDGENDGLDIEDGNEPVYQGAMITRAQKEVSGSDLQDPIARLTNLGWVCFGPALADKNPRSRSRSNFARTHRTSQALTQTQLDDTLCKFWELESIGIRDVKQEMSMEEKNVVEKVANTISLCDGRYTVGVPWKEEEPGLKINYEAELVQLQSQEKLLKKRGVDIMESYGNIFMDYKQKGYIKKVQKSDSEKQWFLPHFPVIGPEKSSTRVRVVFDAAMSHAQENKGAFPEAADSVDNAMYVDDLLDSAETVESAKSLQSQLSNMLSAAGFNLRKRASDEPAVLENVPPTDRLPIVELSDGESPKTKTLGVLWEASCDVFIFKLKSPDPNIAPTKRTVLSAIASLYDPLQFLSPFVIRAKILMQEIWTEGLKWDDVLLEALKAKWNCWTFELPDLSKVSLPRCLRLSDPDIVELHLFSDASQDAYGSVAYLVGRYKDLPFTSRIVASKSRVAPLKAVTILRLELLGAVLSSQLSVSISHVLTIDRIVFWTYAENVYYWVRNQSRLFKPFVANRIAEVQRTSNPEQWRHVPGEMNPADAATRGLTAVELSQSSFLMEGPFFLKSDESCWPPSPRKDVAKVDLEKRSTVKTFTTTLNETEFISVADYSSLRQLYRVACWIKRFIHNCRQNLDQQNFVQTLSPTELKEAEEFWVKRCQSEAFPNGVKEPCLARLTPTKDANRLLRVNGRLARAESLSYEAKFPLLLPKKHPLTRLVVQNAHETLGHGTGVEHTLTELRARFWIVKGRRVVRDIVSSCKECRRRFRVQTTGQIMAPLPNERLQSLQAFDNVGIDFAGPFPTKQGLGKTRAKRYLCLFTCLATRAVPLEMAYHLDTDSFVNAFPRMTSRRGTLSYVITDNGTNFVGAEREIRELVQQLEQDKIVEMMGKYHPIEWKFNPPSAPHFGGVFEAMVKSA